MSKKQHIIGVALPLILRNGFKGTSIDMVVRQSVVSKPTVYNHFQDKAALMLAVIEHWVETNKPSLSLGANAQALDGLIQSRWLSDDAVRLYALIIGEGWRFPDARALFWEQYDSIWRKALTYISNRSPDLEPIPVEMVLDQQLMLRLREL